MRNNNNNRTIEKSTGRKNKLLTERAVSFHGSEHITAMTPSTAADPKLRRPKTLPDLRRNLAAGSVDIKPLKLTKLLLNVTVQGSVGAVQVLASPESSVGDLISIVVRQYNKEGRRPVIAADCSRFDLHYSQFSLESLERAEKLQELGSRNFFLCAGKKKEVSGGGDMLSASSSCSTEAEKETKRSGFPWLKFIDFRL
ncbi:Uncharacterized protein At4g22758 [Linum grandiflorum]